MKFQERLHTLSVDDQMFLRRFLGEHECSVCHDRTLCTYDIWSDAFVCSQECHAKAHESNLNQFMEAPVEAAPEPVPAAVEPVAPVAAEKPRGRSKKA